MELSMPDQSPDINSNFPSPNSRYLRPRHEIVLPKNPAIQKQNPIASSIGNNNQFTRARSTRTATKYAANARTTIAIGTTGHHAGENAQTSTAIGNGMVNNCPTYPAGRERLVLRAHRNRCETFSANDVVPM